MLVNKLLDSFYSLEGRDGEISNDFPSLSSCLKPACAFADLRCGEGLVGAMGEGVLGGAFFCGLDGAARNRSLLQMSSHKYYSCSNQILSYQTGELFLLNQRLLAFEEAVNIFGKL